MILDEIVAYKKEELRWHQVKTPLSTLRAPAKARPAPISLLGMLRGEQTALIAEIKWASPSRGTFTRQLDPKKLALTYADHGATAIWVLTSEKLFHGALADGVIVGSEPVRRVQGKDGVEQVRTFVSGLRRAAIRGQKGER